VAVSRQVDKEVAPLVVEEAAPMAVSALQKPPARANKHVSSLMMMRSHPMRTSLCRSDCGNFPVLQG
jgi:hypothetical protein